MNFTRAGFGAVSSSNPLFESEFPGNLFLSLKLGHDCQAMNRFVLKAKLPVDLFLSQKLLLHEGWVNFTRAGFGAVSSSNPLFRSEFLINLFLGVHTMPGHEQIYIQGQRSQEIYSYLGNCFF